LTESAQSPLRIVAFGDLDAGVWGAAIGAGAPVFVASIGHRHLGGAATIAGTEGDDAWSLSAEALELTISPAGERVSGLGIDGFDQLCRVTGRLAGEEANVDCLGRRGERDVDDPRDFDSVRDVSIWFAVDDGLAVTAARRRKAKGHDRDLTVAAILETAEAPAVEEPRLSTTYDADGTPARVGVELWLPEHNGEQPFPRRAAGEAAGASVSASGEEGELTARPMRCHSRGNDGTGVYVLLQRP
jgi:hypothetical protein